MTQERAGRYLHSLGTGLLFLFIMLPSEQMWNWKWIQSLLPSIELPPPERTQPAPMTRDDLCKVRHSFQGAWYTFDPDFPVFSAWTPEVGDDWTGGLTTNNGSGDYTHWAGIKP